MSAEIVHKVLPEFIRKLIYPVTCNITVEQVWPISCNCLIGGQCDVTPRQAALRVRGVLAVQGS
jgi:hypothetical protein